ncbi:hypothetical protein QUF58_07260 [Anaerolineales bacterium HSG24]|nr:hypothetical protein [Anaerolineales bacterium HSG24]
MFPINYELLEQAKQNLSEYKNIYWIIGGACSGKSTICRMIAKATNILLYNMDDHIFGTYMPRYTENRHPASKAWFSAKTGLDWILSLSVSNFESLNRAANAEYLDLFAQDIKQYSPEKRLLVDGGISYPAILAQTFPVEHVVCLYIPPHESRIIWETVIERKPMQEMILGLPDGDKKWDRFLCYDKHITESCLNESQAENIRVFSRDKQLSAQQLCQNVLDYFGCKKW